MKFLTQLILLAFLGSSLHAQIDRYKKNILTTNDVALGSNLSLTNGVLDITGTAGLPVTSLNLANFNGLTGILLTKVYLSNLPSGDTDILTVTNGTRVMVMSFSIGTTNALSFYGEVKTNGVYTKLTSGASGTSLATNGIGSLFAASQAANPYIFEFGETVAVNTTAIGANVHFLFGVLDSTVPIVCNKRFALSGGNESVYTVSAGKRAISMQTAFGASIGGPNSTVLNRSSANRLYKQYIVPSGGSADSTSLILQATVSNNGDGGAGLPVMDAGETYVISSDASTATQIMWITSLEVPR